MALSITTVTNSIAALSVTGVTIKDIDEIPASVDAYDCPILYPEPVDFVTNLTVTAASFQGKYDVEYDLTYTFLYAQIGEGGIVRSLQRVRSKGLPDIG